MKDRSEVYLKWIARRRKILGRCAEVTMAMVKVFPELRRARGHYDCPYWGMREHWWCVAPDGAIFDPTAAQFPSKGVGEYIEHVDGSPTPTGKCLDCGGYVYNGDVFCCSGCEQRTLEYMQSQRFML